MHGSSNCKDSSLPCINGIMLLVEILYVFRGKGKGKFHPRTGHEGPEGE